ncbi:MAG: DUF4321 domain-containing protein [Bacilli bacterium]
MKKKNIFVLLVFLLSGIVVGSLIAEFSKEIEFLWWLAYGDSFGLASPITLDLKVIILTFGITFKLTIAHIIGLILAAIAYKHLL